jgi:phosphate/sulfate permease
MRRRSIWFWLFVLVVIVLLLGLMFGGYRKGQQINGLGPARAAVVGHRV